MLHFMLTASSFAAVVVRRLSCFVPVDFLVTPLCITDCWCRRCLGLEVGGVPLFVSGNNAHQLYLYCAASLRLFHVSREPRTTMQRRRTDMEWGGDNRAEVETASHKMR